MFFAPRERFGPLRAGTALLALANLVAAGGVLAAGAVGGRHEPLAAGSASPPPVAVAAPATVLAASVHPLLVTTTTAVTSPGRAPTTTPRVRSAASNPAGRTRRVVSTGYCLDGVTSSGATVGPGMVAMNGVALGSRWLVHDGPFDGATLEVTDRIGHSTEFDIWFDDCADAVAYGRRTITVERVG